jgi:hypothetical protein
MNTLIESHARVTGLMAQRGSGLPLTLSYIDPASGTLVLGLSEWSSASIAAARELAGNVPLRIVPFRAVRHANKGSFQRPLIGGIGVKTAAGGIGVGTICIAATRDGKSGFVTAGHVVSPVGTAVYQPQKSTVNNWLVGSSVKVTDFAGTANSDSAFVELAGEATITADAIWKSSASVYTKTGISDPVLGTDVFMQGASTQTTERPGKIAGKDVTVTFEDGGTLLHQLLANYLSAAGDSGGPVYVKGVDPSVLLVGLNVGAAFPQDTNPPPNEVTYPPPANGRYGIISPWAAVVADLGLS